jgi:glycogen debranching enzyme
VATLPPSDPAFDARRYWRGPVWAPVNWLAADGLAAAGLAREAAGVAGATLDLVRGAGFAEYFDPTTGAACGAPDFSWTAAISLDLLDRGPAGSAARSAPDRA